MVIPFTDPSQFFSLYFHFPFCTKKCPYCHFFVLPDQEDLKASFLKGILKEWELRFPYFQNKEMVSLYFGGGTPTLFPEGIKEILERAKSLHLSPNIEITVEANPEEVTLPLMRSLKEWGVNRISMGVQSFDEATLRILGRNHSAKKAISAIETIAEAGIENISIDLMYELPSQTVESWKETVKQTATLPITHLSLYNLTFEPNTLYYKKRKQLLPTLPKDESSLEMLTFATDFFESIGLKRYEISAFAKEEKVSIHNTGYWIGRPFLGFGPSAFSFIEGSRFRNHLHLKRYCEDLSIGKLPIDFEEKLPYPANVHELLAIRLRLFEGIDLKNFEMPSECHHIIRELEKEGFLIQKGDRIALTRQGHLFYDTVAEKIIL